MPQQALSVIVPCGNSVEVLEDCLRSVQWADELLVVDSFSRDGSYEIAQRYADRVLRHEYINSAAQKNWIIPQARHPWILLVDTDERITSALRDEVVDVLSAETPYAGYRIPRRNYVLGKPLTKAAYWPDFQVRLFRRDQARYESRKVHAHVLLDGPVGVLQSPLVHYAHRTLDQTLSNLLIRMTTWEADQRGVEMKATRRFLPLWFQLVSRPIAAFVVRYLIQGGWQAGYRGLIVSMIWSMYVAITYMKIYENSLELSGNWWHDDWERFHGHDAESV